MYHHHSIQSCCKRLVSAATTRYATSSNTVLDKKHVLNSLFSSQIAFFHHNGHVSEDVEAENSTGVAHPHRDVSESTIQSVLASSSSQNSTDTTTDDYEASLAVSKVSFYDIEEAFERIRK